MSILETIFIGGVAAAILALIGSILSLLQYFTQKKKIAKLPKKKFKSKKKNKKIAGQRKLLQKKKKRSLKLMIFLMIVSVAFAGASGYLSYYQSMNLTADDSDSVVKGYYLLRDFEEQLILARDQGDEEEKLQQNIRYLATAMASYGTKKASTVNSQEGQLVLNRYYNATKQLGMNASTQTKNFYNNPTLVEEFLKDIAKAQEYEQAAFAYYKVNEDAFSEEK
ncbi:hypothetical protein [Enterococcus wangshanyuanii]|uniref:Uncharacterized protein n=1 Tax=Enterococcus wangshanyuanii TaxID=2005703 RepID=A0ABQ1P7E7_9ENTE|nr:hypothetical protein [Enterococcus wangshanyuanii]GGC90822.1 hypothetical protein GCM10011573_20540 [Enterococcus wangshanyuanii]